MVETFEEDMREKDSENDVIIGIDETKIYQSKTENQRL